MPWFIHVLAWLFGIMVVMAILVEIALAAYLIRLVVGVIRDS